MIGALHDVRLWFGVAASLVIALLSGALARRGLAAWLERARSTMDPPLHQVLIGSMPRSVGVAAFVVVASLSGLLLPVPVAFELLTKRLLPFVSGALAIAIAMRVGLAAISAYGASYPHLKSTAGIGRALTWVLGSALIAALLSDALGVSLAPALTALGVGSLAVALALQDTFSNFFAGLYLLLDKPIRPGDFIQLDAGHEGYVEEIGWRSTHLRTLEPSTIVVPNATLSKAVITNYRDTNPRLTLATSIEVTLDADPDATQSAFDDIVKHAIDVPGVVAQPTPFVRFSLGDRGLLFTMSVTIARTADASLVQQELRRRAIVRLRRDGVRLADPNPYAARTSAVP